MESQTQTSTYVSIVQDVLNVSDSENIPTM